MFFPHLCIREYYDAHCILPFSSLYQLGYVIYRRVLRYYSGEEDGLGEFLVQLWRTDFV